MDIQTLETLLLVVRQGSFAAAARVLDVDPSSVSRSVASAEEAIGLRLFRRSTRKLSLTEEGETFLRQIEPLLGEFRRAQDMARGAAQRPSGTLRMTSSVAFAHECIVPHLDAFWRRYPDLNIDLVPTDVNVDLTGEGFDLAIRLAAAPMGDLISRRLLTTRYLICASPEYVASHDAIAAPGDLSRHSCICFAFRGYRTRWRFRDADGVITDVPVSGRLTVTNALALRRAVRDGLGPALLPDWLVRNDIASGRLVAVLTDHACTATEFDTAAWALYPSRSFLPQKVRVMIDFLHETLDT